jgi:hypothetical protein
LIELWRRRGARGVAEGAGLAVAVVAAILLPYLIAAPHGIAWALRRQLDRPLQVESFPAAFFAVAHLIAGVHLHVVKSAGSDNLVGSWPDLASTLSGVVTALAVLAVYVVYARSSRTREELAVASVAAVTAYVAFSKVFSPQYLIWLIPLVPLVGGRRGIRAGALLIVTVGMTQVWEPWRYGHYYRTFAPWLTSLVVVRDLLVVAMLAVLLWPASRSDTATFSGRNADELDPVSPAVV